MSSRILRLTLFSGTMLFIMGYYAGRPGAAFRLQNPVTGGFLQWEKD